jgi:hypothetical protein
MGPENPAIFSCGDRLWANEYSNNPSTGNGYEAFRMLRSASYVHLNYAVNNKISQKSCGLLHCFAEKN